MAHWHARSLLRPRSEEGAEWFMSRPIRCFAAHLPLDGRFLELPTSYLARRQLQEVLRVVHPKFPGVMQATDMNAVAVLGTQHRSSVNRLLGPELRSLTDTTWFHPTLTSRMNAAIIVDQNVRRGQVLAEGTLMVTESTPLKEIIDASGRGARRAGVQARVDSGGAAAGAVPRGPAVGGLRVGAAPASPSP